MRWLTMATWVAFTLLMFAVIVRYFATGMAGSDIILSRLHP